MTESIWNGFRRIDFEFENMYAILVFPKEPNENKNRLLKQNTSMLFHHLK